MSQIAHSNSNASSSQLTSTIRKAPAAPTTAAADFAGLLLGRSSRAQPTAEASGRRDDPAEAAENGPLSDRANRQVDAKSRRPDQPAGESDDRPVSRSQPANPGGSPDGVEARLGDIDSVEESSELTWVATLLPALPPDEIGTPILENSIATLATIPQPADSPLLPDSAAPLDTVLDVPADLPQLPPSAGDSAVDVSAEGGTAELQPSDQAGADATNPSAASQPPFLGQTAGNTQKSQQRWQPTADDSLTRPSPQESPLPEGAPLPGADRSTVTAPGQEQSAGETETGALRGDDLPSIEAVDKPNVAGAVDSRADIESVDRATGVATGQSAVLTDVQQERLVDRVRRAFLAARQRGGPLRIRLHPPELGSLKLELQVQRGGVRASLETDTVAAKSVLVEHLVALKERLAESGLRIDSFDVRWRDPGEARQQSNQGETFQQDRSAHRALRGGKQRGGMESVTETAPRGAPTVNSGRLNVRV